MLRFCYLEGMELSGLAETPLSADAVLSGSYGSALDPKFLKCLKSWLRNGDRVVFCRQPLEDAVDVAGVNAFLSAASSSRANLYYPVRPNEYTGVGAPAMIAFCFDCLPADLMATSKIPGSSFLSRLSPGWGIGTAIRKLLRIAPPTPMQHFPTDLDADNSLVGEEIPGEKIETAFSIVEGEALPKPSRFLPSQLRHFDGPWEQWLPDQTLQHRNLINRVQTFFPAPESIHVAILNKCNLKCGMCPYHGPEYRNGHTTDYFETYRSMTPEVIEEVLTYAAKYGISVHFGQIEEPFMHKRFLDYLERAKALGVRHVHVTTNGTLLSDKILERFANSGVNSVMFSVDAANPETYEEIRGDSLERLEKQIMKFLALAKPRGIKVIISFINQEPAISERKHFLQRWMNAGVDSVTFYPLSVKDYNTGEPLQKAGYVDQGDRYPCASPWVQSVVMPDGEVSLCCKTMTDVGWRGVVNVGSLTAQSFAEIWNGQKYRKYRDDLLAARFDQPENHVCEKCRIWSAASYVFQDIGPFRISRTESSLIFSRNGSSS